MSTGSSPQERLERHDRFNFTRVAPVTEFGQVHSSIASLAIVNPRLRATEFIAKFALCLPGFFADPAEKFGYRSVSLVMLSFGCHSAQLLRLTS